MCVSCSLSVCLVIEACVTKVERHNTEKQADYQTPIHRTNQPQTAPPVNMRLTATKKHYFLQNRCWPFAVSHYMPSRGPARSVVCALGVLGPVLDKQNTVERYVFPVYGPLRAGHKAK